MVIYFILALCFIALLIDYFDCKDKFIVATIRVVAATLAIVLMLTFITIEVYSKSLATQTAVQMSVNK